MDTDGSSTSEEPYWCGRNCQYTYNVQSVLGTGAFGSVHLASITHHGGDLASLMGRRKSEKSPLAQWEALCYTTQIIDGVQYLHGNNIIHGDLKPGNVLVKPKDHHHSLLIGDLDAIIPMQQSNSNSQDFPSAFGTVRYTSPECLKKLFSLEYRDVGRKADIWSVGCIIHDLANCCFGIEDKMLANKGSLPVAFKDLNNIALATQIIAGYLPVIDDKIATPFEEMIIRCLEVDIKKRPFAADLMRDMRQLLGELSDLAGSQQERDDQCSVCGISGTQLNQNKEAAESMTEFDSTDLEDVLDNLTPLHAAVLRESVTDVQQILSESSTDVNAKRAGLTPLMLASCGRNPLIVQLLLDSPRIDVNAVALGFKSITALMISVWGLYGISEPSQISIVNLLLSHSKCDFTYKTDEGLSALSMACVRDNTAAVDCLLNEFRLEKYALDDLRLIWCFSELNSEMGRLMSMCLTKLRGLKPQEVQNILEDIHNDRAALLVAAMVKLTDIQEEANESLEALDHTINVLRLGKMAVGKFVGISDNETLVRKKQAEHNLLYVHDMCNYVSTVEKVRCDGDVEICIKKKYPVKMLCHPDILDIQSREGYEAIDGSGETIGEGDVVEILADYDTVAELQKGHGRMPGRLRKALGKTVLIRYFDVHGDACIVLADRCLPVNPRALRKVTTVLCGDGSSLKIEDKVRLLYTDSALKLLQTDEYGGWSDSLSELTGRTLTIANFLFLLDMESEVVKSVLIINGGSRIYYLNPEAVGRANLPEDDDCTIQPVIPNKKGRGATSSLMDQIFPS
ncbi:uncharacterized protein LOC129582273 [Paramacrobiotus metropolitanus]|uniref:uncharacterized protein LOC129582273 n=1 Tax=Paramacrobiotus metropolitanus TaxID=2943436 RepID=UPI0024465D17|nr:uncharacterized protein LOC129582273 [Paramacrobiotus metropolitanus]